MNKIGEFELNKIYCMDCLEGLKKIPDKSVDLILTDPPYGMQINKRIFNKEKLGKVWGKSLAEKKDYGKIDWDDKPISFEIICELVRISKNQIIFGGNYIANLLPNSKGWVVWDKRVEDKYNNDFADCELIWTSFDKPERIIRYLWSGMLQGNMKDKEERHHPSQKPLPVIKELLNKYSKKDMIILDPFMGSGTTAVACKQLGRNFLGFEISQKYCDIANKRLQQEVLPI